MGQVSILITMMSVSSPRCSHVHVTQKWTYWWQLCVCVSVAACFQYSFLCSLWVPMRLSHCSSHCESSLRHIFTLTFLTVVNENWTQPLINQPISCLSYLWQKWIWLICRQASRRCNMHTALCHHYDVIRLHDILSHSHVTIRRSIDNFLY